MDDKDIWKKYIKSVTPMKHKGNDFSIFLPHSEEKPSLKFEHQSHTSTSQSPIKTHKDITLSINNHKKAEKNLARSMRRGAFLYNAKIDLHGFSQDRAYDALYSFIEKNYFMQKRHLLIITGKGKFCYDKYQNMGILKPKLPEWFYDSHFAKYVSTYQAAAPKDGGSGAYYVILRKKP